LRLESVTLTEPFDLGPLTALQVANYYPEAGEAAELHAAACAPDEGRATASSLSRLAFRAARAFRHATP
jgi:hypothetical protein